MTQLGSTCTNTPFFRLFNGMEVVCNRPNAPRPAATGTSLKMAVKTSQIMAAPSLSTPLRFVLASLSFPLSNAFHRESLRSVLLHDVLRLSNSVTPRRKTSTQTALALAGHTT